MISELIVVCNTQKLLIGNCWPFIKTVFQFLRLDLPAQANKFPNFLDKSHHVSHSVLMLGDLVVKKEGGEGLDESIGKLGLVVREGGVTGDK